MLKKVFDILEEFKQELLRLYGEKFKKLILYGSYARGNETNESDIDLLIVLNDTINHFKEIDKMGEIINDINLKYDILISVYPISQDLFQEKQTTFLNNVKEEGIII